MKTISPAKYLWTVAIPVLMTSFTYVPADVKPDGTILSSGFGAIEFKTVLAVRTYPYSMRAETTRPQLEDCERICPELARAFTASARRQGLRKLYCEIAAQYVDATADGNKGNFVGLEHQCRLIGVKKITLERP